MNDAIFYLAAVFLLLASAAILFVYHALHARERREDLRLERAGKLQAFNHGLAQGKFIGYGDGHVEGYKAGQKQGHLIGLNTGYHLGTSDGYSKRTATIQRVASVKQTQT